MNQALRTAKRIVVAVIGGTVILLGVALLVLPGPGWVVIFAGLGILATEFLWARRLLQRAKAQASALYDRVRGKTNPDDRRPPAGEDDAEDEARS
jgi:uncharacterized protein (TIGR02611 family)